MFAGSAVLVVATLFAFHRAGNWPVVAWWKIAWPTLEGLMWAVFVAAYLQVSALLPGRLSTVLCSLGSTTFSIYLLHRVVIDTMTLRSWLIPLSVVGGTLNHLLNVLVIVTPISIGLSYLTFTLIEKPFLERRVRYKKQPVAAVSQVV